MLRFKVSRVRYLWTNRQTDMTENITFPHLCWRAVISPKRKINKLHTEDKKEKNERTVIEVPVVRVKYINNIYGRPTSKW